MKLNKIIVLITTVLMTFVLAENKIDKQKSIVDTDIRKSSDEIIVISSTPSYGRDTADTLQYYPLDGGWNGQFIQSPGDAMITAFQMPADGTIKGVNVPIYAWGTGDQQLTISLHKISYPTREDGTTYPASAVDADGWIGGYDMDANGWMSQTGTTYSPGGTAGVCGVAPSGTVVSGSQDPLGTVEAAAGPPGTPTMGLLWPDGFTAATMDPTNHPDYYVGDNTENWTSLADFGSEVDLLQGEWVGVMVSFSGTGDGTADEPTGFFYEGGTGVVDPWVSMKFYAECGGTSGNGGWHIRAWMFNFQLAVVLTGDRGPVFGSISSLPTTVSQDARSISVAATDDNPSGGDAGVAAVTVSYQLDSLTATVNTVSLSLTDGDALDGTWTGALPGQVAGSMVYWSLTAIDVGGNASSTATASYFIFQATPGAPLLFDNATALYGNPLYAPYCYYGWGQNPFDYWSGDYGNINAELVGNYDIIFERSAGADTYGFDSDAALSPWYSQGGKTYVAEGDEWLGNRYGWSGDVALTGSDFAYALGVGTYHPDINGPSTAISKFVPNADDALGAVMADYLDSNVVTMLVDSSSADTSAWDTTYTYASSELYYDPVYDPGHSNWLDGITPHEGANVIYSGYTGPTDSLGNVAADAELIPVAVYCQAGFGSKGGLVAFDQMGLYARVFDDTGAVTYSHWVGAEDYYSDSPGAPVRGILDWAAGVVSIDDDQLQTPERFALKGNYPNPFNPTTNIMFTLNTQSEVTLSVYSILGQEIAQIQSGNMRPGFHSIQWNGLDQSGIQVASGVYFYQLNVAGQSKTGKMMLLK